MDDYEVGYKKPPEHTRFKKGQSGNPKGRPKAEVKHIVEIMFEELHRLYPYMEKGKKAKANAVQISLRQLCAKASKGEIKAIMELLKLKHFVDARLLPAPPPPPPQKYVLYFEGDDDPEGMLEAELPSKPLPVVTDPKKSPW